jgi:hypothetical protein
VPGASCSIVTALKAFLEGDVWNSTSTGHDRPGV